MRFRKCFLITQILLSSNKTSINSKPPTSTKVDSSIELSKPRLWPSPWSQYCPPIGDINITYTGCPSHWPSLILELSLVTGLEGITDEDLGKFWETSNISLTK